MILLTVLSCFYTDENYSNDEFHRRKCSRHGKLLNGKSILVEVYYILSPIKANIELDYTLNLRVTYNKTISSYEFSRHKQKKFLVQCLCLIFNQKVKSFQLMQ